MSAAEIDALLADFRAWLEAGGTVETVEPVGLDTLAAEFTALRHEVHLQTKATRAAVEKLGQPADPREAQRPLVAALADIADVLRTAHEQVQDTVRTLRLFDPDPPPNQSPTGWFGRLLRRGGAESALRTWADQTESRANTSLIVVAPALKAVADGYELSLKRVERALVAAGLEPIPAVGERFDPTTMEAIALDDGGDEPSGTVLAESRRGYRWHGEVFRFSQVTVAR